MRGKTKHISAALSGESHSNGVLARRMAALDGTGLMDEDGSTLGGGAGPVEPWKEKPLFKTGEPRRTSTPGK